MKEFLKKELYSFRAVAAILARWLLLAIPTGLVCGAVGTAFHLAVEHVTEWRAEHIWLLWLLPAAGLAIVALYKVTGCEGMGTNNVIRAVHSGEASARCWCRPSSSARCSPTSAAARPDARARLCRWAEASATTSQSSSASPTTTAARPQPAAWRRSSRHCSARRCRRLSSASWWRTWASRSRWPLSPASPPPSSSMASRCLRHLSYHFALTAPALSIDSTLLVAVLGVACALVARAFCWLLHTMEHEMPPSAEPWVRAVVGGAAVVALSYLMGVGRYNGAGMGVITAAVEQGQALPWDFICKMLLTALTLSAGFKGGEVVPSFYFGATFGCAFGPLLGLPAGFSAAVGLVSVFCGATNTLIPSILLAYELFGGVGLELIALGCGVCYMLSGTHGLYSSQLFVTEKLLSGIRRLGKRLHH